MTSAESWDVLYLLLLSRPIEGCEKEYAEAYERVIHAIPVPSREELDALVASEKQAK